MLMQHFVKFTKNVFFLFIDDDDEKRKKKKRINERSQRQTSKSTIFHFFSSFNRFTVQMQMWRSLYYTQYYSCEKENKREREWKQNELRKGDWINYHSFGPWPCCDGRRRRRRSEAKKRSRILTSFGSFNGDENVTLLSSLMPQILKMFEKERKKTKL